MNPIPFIIQGSNIVLVVDNKPHTITDSHISYEKIKEALKEKNWGVVSSLVSAVKALNNFTNNEFEVVGGEFYRNGEVVHGAIATRIVNMYKEGFDINPMLNFIKNLSDNPSSRAVNELYGFLEKSNLPITDDGYFLAYKRVRDNYYDVHSKTVLNKPYDKLMPNDFNMLPYTTKDTSNVTVEIIDNQVVVSMPRNKVNDDKDQTCSYGLHFCSYDYLSSFGGSRIVILKINPADVVSIPSDYDLTKGRTAKYIVLSEIEDTSKAKDAFSGSVDKQYQNVSTKKVPPKPYRKNSRGQWIDATGSFLAKEYHPK